MSTGLIIVIAVAAIALIALLFVMPRMREKARVQKREHELGQRREAVAGEHREVAERRQREAEHAEREARMAQQEAQRQKAEAGMHEERAAMHEQGKADDELIDEHERDRFAGTSADGAAREGSDTRTEFEEGREEERSGRFARQDEPADQPTGRRPA